jgi:hypothetical protein
MSRLQKAPYGFLGAFDLKALGKNPDAISDELKPVVETGPFFYAPLSTQNSFANEPTAYIDGTLVAIGPGPNESWLVKSVSGVFGFDASDTIDDVFSANIAYRESATAVGCALAVGQMLGGPRTIIASFAYRMAITFNTPLLVPNGSELTLASCGQATLNAARSYGIAVTAFVFPA